MPTLAEYQHDSYSASVGIKRTNTVLAIQVETVEKHKHTVGTRTTNITTYEVDVPWMS